MTITGHLPRPLGKSPSIKANWYDICNTDTPEFMKLHKEALSTPFKERTASMRIVIHVEICAFNYGIYAYLVCMYVCITAYILFTRMIEGRNGEGEHS
jgi:hypothetical protein